MWENRYSGSSYLFTPRADAVRSEPNPCSGPECAAQAEEVRDGFGGFEYKQQQQQQQHKRQQQQQHRPASPFDVPKMEYKGGRKLTISLA